MKGHPFLGAFSGFFFGLSLAGFLLTTGTLATDSILLVVFPIAFLVIGILFAAMAPFKRSRLQTAGASAAAAAPPAAHAAPEASEPSPAAAPRRTLSADPPSAAEEPPADS